MLISQPWYQQKPRCTSNCPRLKVGDTCKCMYSLTSLQVVPHTVVGEWLHQLFGQMGRKCPSTRRTEKNNMLLHVHVSSETRLGLRITGIYNVGILHKHALYYHILYMHMHMLCMCLLVYTSPEIIVFLQWNHLWHWWGFYSQSWVWCDFWVKNSAKTHFLAAKDNAEEWMKILQCKSFARTHKLCEL